MRIKEIIRGKVFSKSRFNNTFNDFRYNRKIRNGAVVREPVLIKIRLFKQRRYCRLLKGEMELTRAYRQIDYSGVARPAFKRRQRQDIFVNL